MKRYSDAALAYVETIPSRVLTWDDLHAAYDAGHAAQEEECTTAGHFGAPSPEPVRLTPPFGYVEAIGVGCFASTETPEDDTVINWLGRNFTPQTTEPVRLSDPDDPRIQPGALVSYTTTTNAKGEVTIYHHRVDAIDGGCWSVNYIRQGIPHSEYHLLAPTPDPDADTRQALIEIMTGIGVHDLTTDEATQVIMGLRERGVSL